MTPILLTYQPHLSRCYFCWTLYIEKNSHVWTYNNFKVSMIFLLRFLRHVTFGARPFSPSGNTKTVPRKLQGNIHTHTPDLEKLLALKY